MKNYLDEVKKYPISLNEVIRARAIAITGKGQSFPQHRWGGTYTICYWPEGILAKANKKVTKIFKFVIRILNFRCPIIIYMWTLNIQRPTQPDF